MKLWRNTLTLLKFACGLAAILSYFLQALLLWPGLMMFPNETRKILSKLLKWHSQLGLKIFGIHIHTQEQATTTKKQTNYFIVSNHLSYLDILIIISRFPACFVTSKEIKELPFLGQLVTLAGCLFVERRNKNNLNGEIQEIKDALMAGLNVVVFPEATSTNGQDVLRFRNPLYQSAIDCERPILPLCLNYKSVDGKSICKENRDTLFWYGHMTFLPHFWNLMKCRRIEVEMQVLTPIGRPRDSQRETLALLTHALIKRRFRPIS